MVIYKPKGKAREYSEWAVNLYRGCGMGCVYCYAPSATRRTKEQFSDASPRTDILAKLARDAAANEGKAESVLLSFTSDPYQPLEKQLKLTRTAIKILKSHGIGVNILTKGGMLSTRDFDLLGDGDKYGTTLTFMSTAKSLEWEPHAAVPADRINALRAAKQAGLQTWVSLEPVIDVDTALSIVADLHDIVDKWKVGKLNYHPIAKSIDWRAFALDIIEELDSHGADYLIKKDLKAYLTT